VSALSDAQVNRDVTALRGELSAHGSATLEQLRDGTLIPAKRVRYALQKLMTLKVVSYDGASGLFSLVGHASNLSS